MKKLLLFLFMFYTLTANAQTIIINFAGTGESFSVSSVIVENLTTAVSTTITSGKLLRLNVLTDVSPVENKQLSELKIYPNPMTDNAVIQVKPPVAGMATITVSDLNGKQIAQSRSYLENYLQEFRVSGIKSGLYIVSVKGRTFLYSGKLLSEGKSRGGIKIDKVSSNIMATAEKESTKGSKSTPGYVDMDFTTGDRLKFTGISGIYSTVITDIPLTDKTITFNFIACTDGDNINYPVVDINGQVWMAENLKTSKYSNGDPIGTTTPADLNIEGESTPKYQWAYDGIESNVAVYGRLYTWFAMTDDRNICPSAWHVPSDLEWTTLTASLEGESVAGGKLKEKNTSHWNVPNTGATNESGFTALPGGARSVTGIFSDIGHGGYWWSSVQYDILDAFDQLLGYNYTDFVQGSDNKKNGLSVRCLYGTTPTVTTTAVTTFTSTEATVGGDVTFDGNASVTDRGVYWGTSPGPGTTGSKYQIGSGTGTFSASLPGLTPNTRYYVQAYATNSNGTSFGEEAIFTTSIAIGDSYEGGIVAYILVSGDPGYDESVKHGLIVAPTDQNTGEGAPWGCGGTFISGLGIAIGSGSQNTTAIVAGCLTDGIAARLCDDLDLNGYTDWYLPSKDELNQLYINKVAIGVIGDNWYLSSSQNDDPAKKDSAPPPGYGYVWGQDFSNGTQYKTIPKGNLLYVRAVRSF